MGLKERVEELHRRRAVAREMGGEEKVAKQKARGKLTVRERVERLFDPGTFFEIGILGTHHIGYAEIEGHRAACDGVVAGYGKVNGRMAACAAYDFTVFGGSIGVVGEKKVTRLREIALRQRFPMIWLIDSAGARIHAAAGNQQDMLSWFADSGYLFREQVVMSGVVPQVSAMVGPGAAGTAYIPGLADFVPMVKGTSSMALGGPPLVKAVVGEDVTEEELGGARLHTEESGCADLMVEDDGACLEAVKEYLSYFPQHCGERPPRAESREPKGGPDDLLDILPDSPRRAYDMHKVIERVVDGGHLFELKPRWARNIITGLCRVGGRPVGVVANNPMHYGGVLDIDASDKSARFVNLCDAFNIPLLFLVDVPGFMVGTKVEKAGIIRHGAKMLYAVSEATVPKLTVILRKAYGAGYYVMCGRAYEPDLIVAWPTAEISVMGPEGMVGIAGRKVLAQSEDPDAVRQQLVEAIRPHIDIFKVAGWGFVDEVIDPRETRRAVLTGLEIAESKQVLRPARKNGVRPV
jgi:acetyl-CoA carboxylase carboxyltransferase component